MGRLAAPTSPLSALLERVGPIFSKAGDATPILIGKGHLEHGIGAGPRVVLVPDTKGKWGPPPKQNAGYLAGVTSGCMVYVRGAESGGDATRFAAAEALAQRVINVVHHLAPGRTTGGPWGDDSPVSVEAFGADLAFGFTYTWPVPTDPVILAAIAAALTPTSAEDPMRPNGDAGTTFTIEPTTNGSR